MIVVDASVVNKFFLPYEDGRDKALSILKKHIQKIDEIIVPDLLFYEVANTLATKTTIPQDQISKALTKLDKIKLNTFHPTIDYIKRAAIFAKQHNVSVYDAVYAILAKEKKCNLITADKKFVLQTKQGYIVDLKYESE